MSFTQWSSNLLVHASPLSSSEDASLPIGIYEGQLHELARVDSLLCGPTTNIAFFKLVIIWRFQVQGHLK